MDCCVVVLARSLVVCIVCLSKSVGGRGCLFLVPRVTGLVAGLNCWLVSSTTHDPAFNDDHHDHDATLLLLLQWLFVVGLLNNPTKVCRISTRDDKEQSIGILVSRFRVNSDFREGQRSDTLEKIESSYCYWALHYKHKTANKDTL